jgi:hypothetical protein
MRAVSRRSRLAGASASPAPSTRKPPVRGRKIETPAAGRDESGVRVAALAEVPTHDIAAPLPERPSVPMEIPETDDSVRLIVHGWHNVQPGTLSWVFPTVEGAIRAVHAMRNAVRWAVVRGTDVLDLAVARKRGAIVLEDEG